MAPAERATAVWGAGENIRKDGNVGVMEEFTLEERDWQSDKGKGH